MCGFGSHHSSKRRKVIPSSLICAAWCCCLLCCQPRIALAEQPTNDQHYIYHSHLVSVNGTSDNVTVHKVAKHLSQSGLSGIPSNKSSCSESNNLLAILRLNHTSNSSSIITLQYNVEVSTCEASSEPPTDKKDEKTKWKVWLSVFVSVTLISAVGLIAVALVPLMHQTFYHILIQFLISLAVGSLIGDALLHLIPHALFPDEHSHAGGNDHTGHSHSHEEESPAGGKTLAIYKTVMALVGVLVFFVAERIVIVYQSWRAKSKYHLRDAEHTEEHSAEPGMESSATGLGAAREAELSSDYRTAGADSHASMEQHRNHHNHGESAAGQVPQVRIVKPVSHTASLSKLTHGEDTEPLKSNGKVMGDTCNSAQTSPSKKHRLGWGCQQHTGALSAVEPVPHPVSHSADVLFCGNCNQLPVLQTGTDCSDPMDEESCFKGHKGLLPPKATTTTPDAGARGGLGSSMPFLSPRTPEVEEALIEKDKRALVPHLACHGKKQEGLGGGVGGGSVHGGEQVELAAQSSGGHCHSHGAQHGRNTRPHSHHHGHSHDLSSVRSIAYTILAGDGLHNFCDGIAIGAAFAVAQTDGLAVSLAVLCHELPHELGDFAVLLHAGIPVRLAMYYNLFSSILCYIGAIIGVLAGTNENAISWVFMFTAGMFIYIALVDMVPELSTQRLRGNQMLSHPVCLLTIQSLGIILGGVIMLTIALLHP